MFSEIVCFFGIFTLVLIGWFRYNGYDFHAETKGMK
jgi:hypothetical protein